LLPGAKDYFTSSDGKIYHYGFQWASHTWMYYNPALFDEIGISPPTTYEELFENAKKINDFGVEGLVTNGKGNWAQMLFNYWAGSIFTEEEAKMISSWDFLSDEEKAENIEIWKGDSYLTAVKLFDQFVKEGVWAEDATLLSWDEARTRFVGGKSAMMVSGHWETPIIRNLDPDFDFDYFKLPAYEGRNKLSINFGVGYTVPHYVSDEKLDVIMDFMKTLNSNEDYAINAYDQGINSLSTHISEEKLEEKVDPIIGRMLKDLQEHGTVLIINLRWPKVLSSAQTNMVIGIMGQTITPEEGVQMLYDAALEDIEG